MTSNASLFPHHQKSSSSKSSKSSKNKELTTSTSLAFTSTLSNLLASSSSTSATKPGRPRPSKQKEDIFTSHNRNTKKRAARDLEDDGDTSYATQRHKKGKDIGSLDASVLDRSRKKMEEKAKLYKRMKRGDNDEEEEGGDNLVDFDRKWAEHGSASSDDDEDDGRHEIVDYEDEYGRTKRGTRAEVERVERRKRNAVRGQEELDRMSARPVMPSNIIYGDTVQSEAFAPEEEVYRKLEELAAKRDRSATPPEARHYEADKEFRIKGVGFFNFSKDEGLREKEMLALERERRETERVRGEREGAKEKRKREIEERRRVVGAKKARKQADTFLEGLGGDMIVKEEPAGQ